MRALGVGLLVAALATPAAADPMIRFGMTSGADANAPEGAQVGPMVGVGARLGRVSGEANYAYLSFMDPDTNIHRAGVALRMELVQWGDITRGGPPQKAFYGELGGAKRWGTWRVNQVLDIDAHAQNEMHVGVGYQYGRVWQLGLRLGASRRHPMLDTSGVACRGINCAVSMMPASTGLAESVMAEWTWTYDWRN